MKILVSQIRLIYQIFGRVSIQVLPLALFSADSFCRAEKKPSFPRLLKKSSYIWGRDTNVRWLGDDCDGF
jgi:hypothetical protein